MTYKLLQIRMQKLISWRQRLEAVVQNTGAHVEHIF